MKTRLTSDIINRIKVGDAPAARYIAKYTHLRSNYNYLWDELAAAAWLDPNLITRKETMFMDVDLDRGAGYGNTLSWTDRDKPKPSCSRSRCRMTWTWRSFTKCLWIC